MTEATLWHIEVSHYNEKARWALDYKNVPHVRRAPMPGVHMAVALWMTRGKSVTFPLLELEGERIGDSTRIIERLEQRFPEPPLYPDDPEQRARALALEEFVDEEVAPHVRLLAWHEAIKDRETFGRFVARLGPLGGRAPGVAAALGSAYLRTRFRVDEQGAPEVAKRKIEAGLDRVESELGEDEYLVGDRFTVADLTAASILYPLVLPPQGPQLEIEFPEPLRRYIDSLRDRPVLDWVAEMFRRHRGTSAATRSIGLAATPA
jgi:glutathione S-transferase